MITIFIIRLVHVLCSMQHTTSPIEHAIFGSKAILIKELLRNQIIMAMDSDGMNECFGVGFDRYV